MLYNLNRTYLNRLETEFSLTWFLSNYERWRGARNYLLVAVSLLLIVAWYTSFGSNVNQEITLYFLPKLI